MKASLHTRILLGYGYLVALVVLGGAGAAWGFHDFAAKTERILAENFRSETVATDMIVALERQDSAILGILLGEDRGNLLRTASDDFRKARERAEGPALRKSDREILAEIGRRYEEFLDSRDSLLRERRERPLLAYEEETFPLFEDVKASVFAFIRANQRNMEEAASEVRNAARVRSILGGLLVVVALLSLGLLSRAMRRDLLQRLGEVQSVAEGVARGDRRRRATVQRQDELGVVAAQFNAALDVQEETENRMLGRLAEGRQTLLALLSRLPEPAALFTLSGELVGSRLSPPETDAARQAVTARDLPGGTEAASAIHREANGRRFRIEPLRTPEHRRAGWLALPAPPPEEPVP